MANIRLEDLSPFARAAVTLDREFAELVRLTAQIEAARLDSDGGLDEAVKLLNRFAERGEAIAAATQEFSAAMNAAQAGAEGAARRVGERAQAIKQARERQGALHDRLAKLQDEVAALGAELARSSQADASTDEGKRRLAEELSRVREPMERFIESAQAIKAEAAESNYRRLERQADSVIDSLKSSLRKIAEALGQR